MGVGVSDLGTMSWQLTNDLNIGKDMANSAVATMVVVAYFEMRMASEKEVWELVAEKANRWLNASLGAREGWKVVYEKVKKMVAE